MEGTGFSLLKLIKINRQYKPPKILLMEGTGFRRWFIFFFQKEEIVSTNLKQTGL